MKVLILGASFDTGNLGVSALAESSIKCILSRWPDADLMLFGNDNDDKYVLQINNKKYVINSLPIRFSKNIFLLNHFIRYLINAFIIKLMPLSLFKKLGINFNKYTIEVIQSDLIVDITGGDSFSDIYGMRRFILGFLRKWIAILYKKQLIFLPQTYGPFNKKLTKVMAGYILKKAVKIYSRDYESLDYLKSILKNKYSSDKVGLIPDVAFILEPRKPNFNEVSKFKLSKQSKLHIGLNISGLLFYGGYNQKNMFNLAIDYKKFMICLIEFFLKKKNSILFLIPHVFPQNKFSVESDPDACKEIYKLLDNNLKEKILLPNNIYSHNEIKYLIGMTDFFLGARMHSCIAAISQCIPTVGLAYSSKFAGVFRTVGIEKYVADMRFSTEEKILSLIEKAFENRSNISAHLKKIIPETKKCILENIFNF